MECTQDPSYAKLNIQKTSEAVVIFPATQNLNLCFVSYLLPCFLFLGRGIPNELAAGEYPATISKELLPSASVVANKLLWYDQELRSTLTFASENRCCADIALLFNHVVNNDYTPFQAALLYLINVTQRYV